MSAIKAGVVREQLTLAHKILEDTFAGITEEQAHWKPNYKAHSVAANFAHVVAQEDLVINALLQGRDPLIATRSVMKSGLSEMPPTPTDHIPNWQDWGDNLKIDLPAIIAYSKAVFENTD
ncbi:MAG TPA: DinB family protein, partial [Phototrophicaceae bacterium]|nr:DinB family protein [Phototrophicaceae bacterium]